jgi:hypothetical protein
MKGEKIVVKQDLNNLVRYYTEQEKRSIGTILPQLSGNVEQLLKDPEMERIVKWLGENPACLGGEIVPPGWIPSCYGAFSTQEELYKGLGASFSDLQQLIQDVKNLELPEELKDPRVKPQLMRLQEELEMYGPNFRGHGIAGLLWGSFLFGDPSSNPDLDFDFIVADEQDEIKELENIGNELPDFLDINMHVTVFNLAKMDPMLRCVNQGLWEKVGSYDDELIRYSFLLTGKVIDLPEADCCNILQALSRSLALAMEEAKNNRFFRSILIDTLSLIQKDRDCDSKKRPVDLLSIKGLR